MNLKTEAIAQKVFHPERKSKGRKRIKTMKDITGHGNG
jgi:hypothetical protein